MSTGFPYPAAPVYYAYPPAAPPRGRLGTALWIVIIAGGLVVMAAAALLAFALRPPANLNQTCSGSNCRFPTSSVPAARAQHTYTSSGLGYSVDWTDAGSFTLASLAGQDDHSISWKVQYPRGTTWPLVVTGEKAAGRSAEAVARQVQQARYPEARVVYTIPQAELGYNPGFGAIYEYTSAAGSGQSQRVRVVIMAAVKKDLAVVIHTANVWRKTDPKVDGSHPNPAETWAVFFIDELTNTVTFPGDPRL